MKGGEAKATITIIDMEEGAEGIGFEAGSLTAGNVDVRVKAKRVKKGAVLIGAMIGEIPGRVHPTPPATAGAACPNCHNPVQPGWRFCINCRTPLPSDPKS